jgi:hypothetical protein
VFEHMAIIPLESINKQRKPGFNIFRLSWRIHRSDVDAGHAETKWKIKIEKLKKWMK